MGEREELRGEVHGGERWNRRCSTLPSYTAALVLSKDRMSEIRMVHFSGLNLLDKLLWSILLLELMFVSVAAVLGHIEASPKFKWMSMVL